MREKHPINSRYTRSFTQGDLLRIIEPADETRTLYRNSPPISGVPVFDSSWPLCPNERLIGFWERPMLAIVTEGINMNQRVPVMIGDLSGWVPAHLVELAEAR
jgi:hypothetical protein